MAYRGFIGYSDYPSNYPPQTNPPMDLHYSDSASYPAPFVAMHDQQWPLNIDPALRDFDHVNSSYPPWVSHEEPSQPLKRFLTETQKPLFTTTTNSIYQPSPTAAATLYHNELQPYHQRQNPPTYPFIEGRSSPASSNELSTTFSSSLDSSSDGDWYPERTYRSQMSDPYALSQAISRPSPDASNLGYEAAYAAHPLCHGSAHNQAHAHSRAQGQGQVHGQTFLNLSQVQVVPDLAETATEHDGITAANRMAFGADYVYNDMDSHIRRLAPVTLSMRRQIDSSLGPPLMDDEAWKSVPPSIDLSIENDAENDTDADADADAETDLEMDVHFDTLADAEEDGDIDDQEEDEGMETDTYNTPAPSPTPSDEDYIPTTRRTTHPRSRPRTRPFRTLRTPRLPPGIHLASRITKSRRATILTPSSMANNTLACPLCPHPAFKDLSSLNRHVKTHARIFVCAFDFAGCTSTFASKNEWKRHVSSRHLGLVVWKCAEGDCGHGGASGGGSDSTAATFNRKDLYTQHLRRMHAQSYATAPSQSSGPTTAPTWEQHVKALQADAETRRRNAPVLVGCPYAGCHERFEGVGAWDERMEHVGRHAEGARAERATAQKDGHVALGVDELLVKWAVREGVVRADGGGGWVFAGKGGEVAGGFKGRGKGRRKLEGEAGFRAAGGAGGMGRDVDVDAEGESDDLV